MKNRLLWCLCVSWGLAVGISAGLLVFAPASAAAHTAPVPVCKTCVLD